MPRKTKLAGTLTLGAALALSSASGALAQDNVELDFWTLTFDEVKTDALNKIIDDFEAANPGVTVNMEQRATDEHKDSLRVAAGTDAFPELYFMWAGLGLGGEFVLGGASDDIGDMYEQYGWEEKLLPNVVADATQYGDHHGVGSSFRSQAVYYNKALFEELGLEEPQTYDELVALADTLRENDIYAFAFGGTVDWHLMRLLDNLLEYRCGAEEHDALTSFESNWAESECALAAFEDLQIWSENYIHPAMMGIDNTEATQLWFANQSALALEGDWHFGVIESAEQPLDDYSFFPFPTGTPRLYSFSQGTYVAPGLDDATREAAGKFLDFWTEPAVQEEHFGNFGPIPVTKGVGVGEDDPQILQDWAEFVANSEGTFSNHDQTFPLDVTTEYWRIQNLIGSGEMEPADAVVAMQTFIDNR